MQVNATRGVLIVAALCALCTAAPVLARGGGGGGFHSHMGAPGGNPLGGGTLGGPANPSVPPSLTPDPRLTGSAPLPSERPRLTANNHPLDLKPDPEEARVDRMIKSICRGC